MRRLFAVIGVVLILTMFNTRVIYADFPANQSSYHNYEEMKAELEKIVLENADIASLFSIGTSIHGKDILVLRINNAEKGNTLSLKPGILFVATHHSREIISREVALYLAQYILKNKDNPEISELIKTRDIFIIPMFNPDGTEYDAGNSINDKDQKPEKDHPYPQYQRKNVPLECPEIKEICEQGVNLNRNYVYDSDGRSHPPTSPLDDNYGGPYPFSEPETRAMRDFLEIHHNISMLVSYHSYGKVILYPWAYTRKSVFENPRAGNDIKEAWQDKMIFETLARHMGRMTGYKFKPQSELYLIFGDLIDWAYNQLGIYSFTIELDPKHNLISEIIYGGFYLDEDYIIAVAQKQIDSALLVIIAAGNPYETAILIQYNELLLPR